MKLCAFLLILIALAEPALTDDADPVPHPAPAWIVSPLFGWAENDNSSSGHSDGSPEYGLFVMYASSRFILNNTVFFTDVNRSEVLGNIASVGFYGDPKAKLTWYLGGSYVWHRIAGDPVLITINEPLGKIGMVWRLPEQHLSITPYIGYALQTVDTEVTVSMPGGNVRARSSDRSDIAVYGVSAYWHWRMLGADAKYYLSQDLDHDTFNHHFRVWGVAMFSKQMGLIARFEYEEQNSTRDTSLLLGPAFVF